MKTTHILLLTLSFLFLRNESFAQVPGEQRGLYVNDFITLLSTGHGEIDISKSILSNIPEENKLLQYCMENHFTYITLYDLGQIFEPNKVGDPGFDPILSPAQIPLKEVELRRFICKARKEYCIEFVGGSIGGNDHKDDIGNELRIKQTEPYIFDSSLHGTPYYNQLKFVEQWISSEDGWGLFANAEYVKQALRLVNIPTTSIAAVCSAAEMKLDMLITEYEFWNPNSGLIYWDGDPSGNPNNLHNDYRNLIQDMDVIRNGNITKPIYIETYLGFLRAPNDAATRTACEIAEFIDGPDDVIPTKRRVDRILANYYHQTSDDNYDLFNANGNYANRFLDFCEGTNNITVAALTAPGMHPAATLVAPCNGGNAILTEDNTDYHPIFGALSYSLGAPIASNFLGDYLQSAPGRNIFTVERDYYDDFVADPWPQVHNSASDENRVVPGACQWYTQSYMTGPLQHPVTFLAYATGCSSSSIQDISLVYQGPIEAGISYNYTVVDCDNGTIQNPIITGANTGSIPQYTGRNALGFPTGLQPVHYNLVPGNYCVTLHLSYAPGCGYSYTQRVIVNDNFQIQSVNQPGNALGPFNICGGTNILLQANWNIQGANYQWYLNNLAIGGANTFEYSASKNGNYTCVISGVACNGSSNIITLNVPDIGFRTIVANCKVLASDPLTLTLSPHLAGDLYTWSGAGTVLPATPWQMQVTTSGIRSVTVTNGGCTRTFTKNFSPLMLTSSAPTPPILAGVIPNPTPPPADFPLPANLCPGTLIRINIPGSVPANFKNPFIWSTGETTQNILVPAVGTYSAYFVDKATGCEVESVFSPNYAPPLISLISPQDVIVCEGTNIPLSVTTVGGTAPYTYTWGAETGCINCSGLTVIPNITTTSNATVIVHDNNSCTSLASTRYTVIPLAECNKLTKTVTPINQYATLPVKYTIRVCNTDPTSPPSGYEYTLFDDPSDGGLTHLNSIQPTPFVTGTVGALIPQPVVTPALVQGQCQSYDIVCSYSDIKQNCNVAEIRGYGVHGGSVTPLTPYVTDDACMLNLMGCPLAVSCRIASCSFTPNDHVSIQVLNHRSFSPALKYFKVRLVYPNFLTPSFIGDYNADPTGNLNALSNPIVSGALPGYSNLDVPHSTMSMPLPHSGSPGGYWVNYNYVDVEIHYLTPFLSPGLLGDFDFTYNGAPPFGVNSFHVFAVNPENNLENRTVLGLTNGSELSYWTQAIASVIPGCGYPWLPDATFSINYSGCDGKVLVTSNYSGDEYSSKWDFGDGRTTPIPGAKNYLYDYYAFITTVTDGPTGATVPLYPQILPASSGLYYITHTVYDGNGHANSETLPVFIDVSCCAKQADYNVKDGDQSSGYGSGFTNQMIHIEGEFDINNSFSFVNCNVVMEPGASIVVKNGQDLKLFDSQFSGCSGMWKGIVGEDGTKIISDHGLTISDAETGIAAGNNSYLYCGGATFTDNIVGISSPVNPINQFNNIDYMVIGCNFTSTGAFKPDFAGQAPHGNYGKAGIVFNDMLGSLGMDGYVENKFSNLNSGIQAYRSNLNIENNVFEEIHSEGNRDYGDLGQAVLAFGSRDGFYMLDVAPFQYQSNAQPTINHCDFGVVTQRTGVRVHNNIMRDVISGVICTNTSNDMPLQVEQNNIVARSRGVLFSENPGAHHLVANDNVIKTTFTGGIGIEAEESSKTTTYLYAERNTLSGIENKCGISATNITGESAILENSITSISSDASGNSGIAIYGCSGINVSCNYIMGASSSSNTATYGIRQSISGKMKVACNSVNKTFTGFEFDGVNAGTSFKSNEMHQHQEGLHLNNVAVIDPQVQAGNLWYGPFGNGGSPSYGAVNLNYFGLTGSRFYSNAFAGNIYFPNSLPSSGWFQQQSGTAATCATSVECVRPNPKDRVEEERTLMDMVIATGGVSTVEFLPESRNMAKHYLYEKLKENPDLLSDATMQSFFIAESATPVSELTTVKEDISGLNYYDGFFSNNIKLADSLISDVNDSLQILDSLRLTNGSSSALEASAAALHAQVNTLHTTIKTMVLQRDNQRIGEKVIAESNNNAVISAQIPEQNEKLINAIHLATDAVDVHTYTTTQESQILSVAQQCPYSGGVAVYQARVKYKKIHPGVTFDDASACLAQGIFRTANISQEEKDALMLSNRGINIRPNPAQGNATISYLANGEIDCKMQITDLTGKLIKEFDLPCKQNSYSFSTETFAPGFYMVKVYDNGTLVGKSKFGIVK